MGNGKSNGKKKRAENNLMIELGHLAVNIAIIAALIQALLPILQHLGNKGLIHFSPALSIVQALLMIFSFLMLAIGFARSDFSVLLIYQHSHTLKPMLYKITALWGNHEGSLLLWLVVMTIFSALLAIFGAKKDIHLRFYTLAIQGGSIFLFGLFMLLTSNPFARILPMPQQGEGFNPILQDPGLAFHPPTLYLGYVGLSTVFSLAIGGLINGKIDQYWAHITRIFALLAWLFLSAGIALGSFWAYYELGWGGFWFWDPVENSSLMPWLLTTALIHSLAVLQKSNSLKHWTVFLSIMGFGLSLIGTFLVRSGILTSVHSFANDPERGVFILLIIAIMLVGGFLLYALRGSAMHETQKFAPFSREGLLVFNNVFLLAMAGTVFLGTFYPLAIELINGARISVGVPFYNATFVPLMSITIILMGLVPAIRWRITSVKLIKRHVQKILPFSIGSTIGLLWLSGLWQLPAFLVFLVGLWLLISAADNVRKYSRNISVWAMNIGHIGLGLIAIGAVVASSASLEKNITINFEESFEFQHYVITPQKLILQNESNYQTQKVLLEITDGNRQFTMQPEKRFYFARQQETTEAAIKSFWGHDLYLSLGSVSADNIVIRAYYKRWVRFIWLGALLLVVAASLALIRHCAPHHSSIREKKS